MNKKLLLAALVLGMAWFGGEAVAGDAGPKRMTAERFEASLTYQQGKVQLPGGIATLEVPTGFHYVGPEDAERLLVSAWGNPDGSGTLGMLLPAGTSPFSNQGWGIVILFEENGHVSDQDAASIDFDKLLAGMKKAAREENKEREQAGYQPVELVGWAARPYYDPQTHKLVWAQELRVGNSVAGILNYNVRMLGREGVLILNAVAPLNQLPVVAGQMRQVMNSTQFNPGHRYTDFTPGKDRTADYGVASLVGGSKDL